MAIVSNYRQQQTKRKPMLNLLLAIQISAAPVSIQPAEINHTNPPVVVVKTVRPKPKNGTGVGF